jgi:hypothetical protein
MGKARLARPRYAGAASNEAGVGDGVVRRAERVVYPFEQMARNFSKFIRPYGIDKSPITCRTFGIEA